MGKYFIKRLIHGIVSIIIVVGIVMVLIYSMLDRELVFAKDPKYTKVSNNVKIAYKYDRWESYGYLDYVPYADWLKSLVQSGELDEETRQRVVSFGRTASEDSEEVAEYVQKFTEYYESQGYTVERKDAKMATKKKVADGGQQQLYAYKDKPLISRLWTYFTGLIDVDNINYVEDKYPDDDIGEKGLTFTLHDPAYADGRFSPAIMGNGTKYKYLLYTDSSFPYIHQNLVTINLGVSYSVNTGEDVADTMSHSQGSYVKSTTTYPTGLVEESADDLHSASYQSGSLEGNTMLAARFVDNYTNTKTVKNGHSRIGYSFIIGIISTASAYILGLPLGILMARKKDKFVDKLGTVYIVFIIAVPSLAYIFLFKAIGGKLGLPTAFNTDQMVRSMYILPIVSLALPSIANLMKWMRRYMIDQMNSDYVKFARSGGLTEGEIFNKHIMKNASIPIIQGIPASVLFAMTGAIITERVYAVPGAGGLLTTAIAAYDNGVIVGVTLFYAVLSVIALILGDILMAMVDPRISFSSKAR